MSGVRNLPLQILKVKNRLDARMYAIKRIRLSSDAEEAKRIAREVLMLSRLNHKNVVRYNQAWIERAGDEWDSDRRSTGSEMSASGEWRPGNEWGVESAVKWSVPLCF